MNVIRDFYNKFIQSCTNLNFFKYVISRSNAESFKFAFIIILIISIVIGIRQGWLMSEISEDVLNWAEDNLPAIFIKDGTLTTQAKQPYITEYKNFPVFLDTTGKIKNLDKKETGVLIKENEVIYKIKGINATALKFDKIKELKLDAKSINQMEKNLKLKMIPLVVFFMYIYFCIVKFLHIFLFSFLGIIVSKLKDKNLNYKEILNISIYAFSPVALLSIILGSAGLQNTISWLVYNIVYAFYLVSAIFYVPSKQEINID